MSLCDACGDIGVHVVIGDLCTFGNSHNHGGVLRNDYFGFCFPDL